MKRPRILGNGGRLVPPLDRAAINPSQRELARGALRRPGQPITRFRGSSIEPQPTRIGDQGPVCYWHADDYDETTGRWPDRAGCGLDLVAEGTPPVKGSTFAGEALSCVEFSEGGSALMRSGDLPFLGCYAAEIVMTIEVTGTPGTEKPVWTMGDGFTLTQGQAWCSIDVARQLGFLHKHAGALYNRVNLPALTAGKRHVVSLRIEGPDGITIGAHVNGVRAGYRVVSDAVSTPLVNARLSLGDPSGTYTNAPIRIREIAIYNRELSLAERDKIVRGSFGLATRRALGFARALDGVEGTDYVVWEPGAQAFESYFGEFRDVTTGLRRFVKQAGSSIIQPFAVDGDEGQRYAFTTPDNDRHKLSGSSPWLAANAPFTVFACFDNVLPSTEAVILHAHLGAGTVQLYVTAANAASMVVGTASHSKAMASPQRVIVVSSFDGTQLRTWYVDEAGTTTTLGPTATGSVASILPTLWSRTDDSQPFADSARGYVVALMSGYVLAGSPVLDAFVRYCRERFPIYSP